MKFNTLYKTYAVWKTNVQPKNHLSSEGSFAAFCSRKQVEHMGGELEYTNGKWFAEGVCLREKEVIDSTCAYCYAHASILISKENKQQEK